MKIGIISLGLIGTSLLKSLSCCDFDIVCVTRNEDSINKAKKICNHVSNDMNTLIDCEVVFVCCPISETENMLDKLENIVSYNCIVLDVASVKEFIMKKKRPYKFIGSHPMAGTEGNGFDAGFKELFEGAKWVLCPSENIDEKDIKLVQNIIKCTGASTIIANPKEHDYAVALISHVPMYIAQALFETALDNELAKHLASSGFRDMTRLAMSNTKMANDMLHYNSENILNALKIFNDNLDNLKYDYKNKIEKIYSDRRKMYSKDGKNIL